MLSAKWIASMLIVLLSSTAWAEDDKLALVIGNSAYSAALKGWLNGPDNDADAMSQELRKAGFEIVNGNKNKNLTLIEMRSALDELLRRITRKSIVVVYYSGHGLEDDKQNFLVPIDAKFKTYNDVHEQTLALEFILDRLAAKEAKTRIIILDSCRNFPLSLRHKSLDGMKALASAKRGTRIIYSASPGEVSFPALHRNGRSHFTEALLKAFSTVSGNLADLLAYAGEETARNTRGEQHPWDTGDSTMTLEVNGGRSASTAKLVLCEPGDYSMFAHVATEVEFGTFGFDVNKRAYQSISSVAKEEVEQVAREAAEVCQLAAYKAGRIKRTALRIVADVPAAEGLALFARSAYGQGLLDDLAKNKEELRAAIREIAQAKGRSIPGFFK